MGISPMQVGNLYPPLIPQILDDDDQPIVLDSVTFHLVLRDRLTGTEKTGQGTFIITNVTDGIFQYSWAAADTNTAGEYDILVTVTKDGLPFTGDPIFLEILP